MMRSPMMKMLFKASLWISAIAAFHIGLSELFTYDIVPTMLKNFGLEMLVLPLKYLFGLSGAFALFGLLMEALSPRSM